MALHSAHPQQPLAALCTRKSRGGDLQTPAEGGLGDGAWVTRVWDVVTVRVLGTRTDRLYAFSG